MVPADTPAPNSARPSADMVLTIESDPFLWTATILLTLINMVEKISRNLLANPVEDIFSTFEILGRVL